ncbi:MAG: hypothetical protein K8S99_02685 [Planctomycetes bacterium]|nr:hypothetical protein [Planctomycetota bacterium]
MQVLMEPQPASWKLPSPPLTGGRGAIVATGHQAWLWHPGILAKDIAAALFARQHNAEAFHLVVDHDPVDSFRVELPLRDGDRLSAVAVHLAPVRVDLPPCSQPSATRAQLEQGLRNAKSQYGPRLACSLDLLKQAIARVEQPPTLGEQLATLTATLMHPHVGAIPMRFSSALAGEERFSAVVERMLRDARKCTACYNRAAAAHPAARVAPLIESVERVELPLWSLSPGQPRLRLFADLSDRVPELVNENGDPVRPGMRLAPRALLMTAYLRSGSCDLFIHGKGGGVYDLVTEAWWREWTGEPLAPMAVVSADVRMDFDAPVADRAAVDRAVWLCHHLPHNIERELDGDAPAADHIASQRKHEILGEMGFDRNRKRRAALFRELHELNHGLATRHASMLDAARRDLERTRAGLANGVVARRRDWCFVLYPPAKLEALRLAVAQRVSAP